MLSSIAGPRVCDRSCARTLRRRNCSPAICTSAQGAASPIEIVKGVKGLSGRYDVWLLDQFGVLHDGKVAYPEAIETCKRLAEAGRRLVVISNSSRRSETTLKKLEPMGFSKEWFSGAITSGELTHRQLASRKDPWFAALGRRCLHITWTERGAISLDGLGLSVVDEPEQADFVLAHGMEGLGSSVRGGEPRKVGLEEIRQLLGRAAARKLPLIIANPDVVTVSGASLLPMPGQLGLWYKEIDATLPVRIMGKPDAGIYEAASLLCGGADTERIVAVGDSLTHDIAGANSAGIDSVFISGGIHASDLGVSGGAEPAPEALANVVAKEGGYVPTFAVGVFRW